MAKKARQTTRSKGNNQLSRSERANYRSWAKLGFTVVFVVLIVGYETLRSYLLDSSGVMTQGIIIDKKTYNRSKTIHYIYSFKVDGEAYTEDTNDPSCKIGDTVDVKYAPAFPRFSKRVRMN